MADFMTAHRKTAKFEGGYVNHPADPGGETYKGVSRRAHPDWPGWKIIDTSLIGRLDENQELQGLVHLVYRQSYWDKLRLDEVTSQRVASETYDTAVNLGTHRAGKFLQIATRALGYDLKIDSVIGSQTLWAVNDATLRDHRNEEVIVRLMDSQQGVHYIMQNKPVFIRGWALKRLRNE